MTINGWCLLEYFPHISFEDIREQLPEEIKERIFDDTAEGEEFQSCLERYLSEEKIEEVFNNFKALVKIKEDEIKLLNPGKAENGICIEHKTYFVPFIIDIPGVKDVGIEKPIKIECVIQ